MNNLLFLYLLKTLNTCSPFKIIIFKRWCTQEKLKMLVILRPYLRVVIATGPWPFGTWPVALRATEKVSTLTELRLVPLRVVYFNQRWGAEHAKRWSK